MDSEDEGVDFLLTDNGDDTDLRLARLEDLAVRRPALLNAVMLRQNPHNVAEWHKRVKLFTGDPTKQVKLGADRRRPDCSGGPGLFCLTLIVHPMPWPPCSCSLGCLEAPQPG